MTIPTYSFLKNKFKNMHGYIVKAISVAVLRLKGTADVSQSS